MTIEKIKLNATALLKPFKYHDEMKDTLRSMIETSYHEQIKFEDNKYGDELHKTDWSRYPDFNREWVQYLVPKLHEHFLTCADELNYQGVEVKGMWYQHYRKNSVHNWHIHGENYTGVYYLELPDDTPKTELIDQHDKKITVQANEGDIIIFPSFIIHRGPKVLNDSRKTIISFNLEFEDISKAWYARHDMNI